MRVTRTVYDRPLTGIALGDYALGSALKERELAAELEVRGTPDREHMRCDMEFHDFLDCVTANETLAQQLTVLCNRAVMFWGQSP
jgi:DNA-binding FadR family transcriptional regulator